MTIRTILVDDEKLAVQGLQLRLEPFDDVEIIDTCQNGREAIRAIKTQKPDLVFLDIQMPGFDGFSVVQGVMDVEPPLFVFVTAFEEHAIRAFDANAVNYLMKPVDEDKLADTIERVRNRLAEKKSSEEAEKLKNVLSEVAPEAAEELAGAEEMESAGRFEKLINIKDRGQIFRVDVDSIEKIDAAGDYMCIYTADNSLILRETMKDLEKRLDGVLHVLLGGRERHLEHNLVVVREKSGLLGDHRCDDRVVMLRVHASAFWKRALIASTASLVSTSCLRRRMS